MEIKKARQEGKTSQRRQNEEDEGRMKKTKAEEKRRDRGQ